MYIGLVGLLLLFVLFLQLGNCRLNLLFVFSVNVFGLLVEITYDLGGKVSGVRVDAILDVIHDLVLITQSCKILEQHFVNFDLLLPSDTNVTNFEPQLNRRSQKSQILFLVLQYFVCRLNLIFFRLHG